MEKEIHEQIGLRVSEELNEKLNLKSKEIGISKNALILVLIDLGFKLYDGCISFQIQK